MGLRKALALVGALGAPLLLAVACGGDGGEPPPAPSPNPRPTPPLIRTPTGPTPLKAAAVIDLATAEAQGLILGVDAGDLRSDLPALVTGDFNGDGAADILLGARFGDGPDNTRQDAGEAYVIFGPLDPQATVDLAAGEADLILWGASPGDNLGFAAAAADLNGDGIDDIVLGAPFMRDPQNPNVKLGGVLIIFGGPDLGGSLDLAVSDPDVTILGPSPSSFLGDSLAAGDVNGDGAPDLIAGATFALHAPDPGQPPVQTGAAYLFFGRSPWPALLRTADGEYDAAVFGAEEFDELGDTVASGDINGDGIDDIILTAEAADGPDNGRPVAAEVYVLLGSRRLGGDYETARGDYDLIVFGADPQDTLGFSLASADLDGDGAAELIMGARLDDNPLAARTRTGAVYILRGGGDLPREIDLASPPPGVAALYGLDDSDLTATAVAADVDGDGRPELLIGSGFADGPENGRRDGGELYVLDGETAAGLSGPGTIAGVPLRAVVYGAREGDQLGTAAAAADIDGDGRPELLVLAANADGPQGDRPDAGQVHIIALPGG